MDGTFSHPLGKVYPFNMYDNLLLLVSGWVHCTV